MGDGDDTTQGPELRQRHHRVEDAPVIAELKEKLIRGQPVVGSSASPPQDKPASPPPAPSPLPATPSEKPRAVATDRGNTRMKMMAIMKILLVCSIVFFGHTWCHTPRTTRDMSDKEISERLVKANLPADAEGLFDVVSAVKRPELRAPLYPPYINTAKAEWDADAFSFPLRGQPSQLVKQLRTILNMRNTTCMMPASFGVPLNVVIFKDKPYVFVNPIIITGQGERKWIESLTHMGDIMRIAPHWTEVVVRYNGGEEEVITDRDTAFCIQNYLTPDGM